MLKCNPRDQWIEVHFPPNYNETTRQYFRVEVYGNLMSDAGINGDLICHGKLECHTINGNLNAKGGDQRRSDQQLWGCCLPSVDEEGRTVATMRL